MTVMRDLSSQYPLSLTNFVNNLNEPAGANASSHQGLAGVLVDDGETLQLLTISARIKHEIVRPHLVCFERR